MIAPPHSILIVGPGKSGTTALYYAIKQSAEQHFARPFAGLFEPREVAALTAFAQPWCVVKMLQERLPPTELAKTASYEKRIAILRDPRDNLISRLTWWCWSLLKPDDTAGRDTVMAMLERKQANPAAMSVRSMFDMIERLSGRPGAAKGARRVSVRAIELLDAPVPFLGLRYEDFVTGRLGALSAYLGFDVSPSPVLGEEHRHLRRTGGHGDWKNWFTQEDIAYFVTPLREAYERLGYDPNEAIPAGQHIAPDTASGFVQAQFARIDGARQA